MAQVISVKASITAGWTLHWDQALPAAGPVRPPVPGPCRGAIVCAAGHTPARLKPLRPPGGVSELDARPKNFQPRNCRPSKKSFDSDVRLIERGRRMH